MRKRDQLHAYQRTGLKHVIDNEHCGLFLDMGLGKTATTLTAISDLKYDRFAITKVLVIAPKRVADFTWRDEIKEWAHLQHLKISIISGPEKARKEAINREADVYTIGRELVPWLVATMGQSWPWDMMVIDESSSFKDHKSARFKNLRMVAPKCKRVVILTGTPAPQGLIDLWSQIYLLDQGKRLGRTIGAYREAYFTPDKMVDHVVHSYKLKKSNEQLIYDAVGDICISMKARDYLDMPPRIDTITRIHLPDDLKAKYDVFEREAVLEMHRANNGVITAANAAALTGKLLQYSNGALYDDKKQWHEVHTVKIDALEERLEAANGNPILCFYWFKHDLERILKHLKKWKPVEGGTERNMKAWNEGKIPFYLLHPASAGHGLNLQKGGRFIEWFLQPWSSELYRQAIARLDRQGQTQSVVNNRLMVVGTMDEDVARAVDRKVGEENALMEAVKARFNKYGLP